MEITFLLSYRTLFLGNEMHLVFFTLLQIGDHRIILVSGNQYVSKRK